ncbi:hypothetical protein LIER_05428 [Lithospermum erythrorhizon]|uniref:PB1-like domain-containing protein n=1 Tax=Lithospermum erythrorhizon TaxID=34254 RepID=A0AAV3P4J7_LITER
MAGQVRENHPDHNDEAFKVANGESRNMFSVRLHYNGQFVGSPNMSYVGGKVEFFDYCDADTFELGSVESCAFRVGLRKGDFSLFVYQDPEEKGFNGLRHLKSPKNVLQFVTMSNEHKFIDVYFVRSGNTNGLDDLEDSNGNLRISAESIERLKALSIERANKLSVIEFHLDDDNCGVVDEVVGGIMDEAVDVDDVLYGQDHDAFDDGDLGGAEPIFLTSFLEQRVKDVVVPNHVEDNHEDDINSQNMEKLSSDKLGKRKKQPVLTRFENSVIDGDVEPETQG